MCTYFFCGIIFTAGIAAFYFARKKNNGEPHNDYFSALNQLLRTAAPGRPLMLIDKKRLLANCALLKKHEHGTENIRLVAKSLASIPLLRLLMTELSTKKLMVFHQPHLTILAREFPDACLLLGKPMPVNAARTFYQTLASTAFNPRTQLQWLIDSAERLNEYLQLATELNTRMRISVEINIGLHRGGIETPQELLDLLDLIVAHSEHLEFSGLMGYDAHVGKIPSLIERRKTTFNRACSAYRQFQIALYHHQPALKNTPLAFNGAGSPTFLLHTKSSPLNDISVGSCLVKPSDFDTDLLSAFVPAAFIATPVLKTLHGVRIPGLRFLGVLWEYLSPNRQRSYFIYGGLWKARYESPKGLVNNALYGKSSNQALVNGSKKTALQCDDYIFMRPTQSEGVLQEFMDIAVIENGEIAEWWPVLPL